MLRIKTLTITCCISIFSLTVNIQGQESYSDRESSQDARIVNYAFNDGDIQSELEYMLDSLFAEVLTEPKIYKVALLDIINKDGKISELDSYLSRIIYESLDQNKTLKIKMLDRELVRRNVYDFGLRPEAKNIVSNTSLWKGMGVSIILIGWWSNLDLQTFRIRLEAYNLESNSTRATYCDRVLEKTYFLAALMGERIPGALVIKSESRDATVTCDRKNYGLLADGWKVIELPVGTHEVRIDKVGYKSIIMDVTIAEGDIKPMHVKFVSPSSAPLAAFAVNAMVPMSASWIYGPSTGFGKFSVVLNLASSSLFYLSAALTAIDSRGSHYFTGNSYERYKDEERYATAGLYVLNLLSGYLVGRDYRNVNKRGTEVVERSGRIPVSISLACSSEETGILMTYRF